MSSTDELRDAHDVLAAFYVDHLAGALERSPVERSVLDLFAGLVTASGLGTDVLDVGCGTGRLEPYLAARGLRPRGVDGVVGWYSLMYLRPDERPAAFAELARVTRPGGHLVTAWKLGDDSHRRGGRTTGLGIEFDVWWLSTPTMTDLLDAAGFETLFWAGQPPEGADSPQGYLVARRTG